MWCADRFSTDCYWIRVPATLPSTEVRGDGCVSLMFAHRSIFGKMDKTEGPFSWWMKEEADDGAPDDSGHRRLEEDSCGSSVEA